MEALVWVQVVAQTLHWINTVKSPKAKASTCLNFLSNTLLRKK